MMPTYGRVTPHAAIIRPGRPRSRVSLGVARTREQESIATKRLQVDAFMKEMTLNTTID
jgi:acyl-CoA thioesterase